MATATQPSSAGETLIIAGTFDENARSRQSAAPVEFGRRSSPSDNASQFTGYFMSVALGAITDSAFNHSPPVDEWNSRVTHWLGHLPTGSWLLNKLDLSNMISGPATVVQWPSHGTVDRTSALLNTLALEQSAVTLDLEAATILARIYERGHATCEDLADWLESPKEWIAFSRLQRARLLYDSGTEFTASPAGRALIQRLLDEGDRE